MKRLGVVFLAVVGLLATTASAQDSSAEKSSEAKRARARGVSVAVMLNTEAVRAEINVTDQQLKKLQPLLNANRQVFGRYREMTEQEREDAMEAAKQRFTKIAEVLTDAQKKRLQEIRLQELGARALVIEDIVKALGISADQKTKIETVREETIQKWRQAMSGGERPSRERMAEMRSEFSESMMTILTPEQQAKLNEMKGKSFDLSQLNHLRDSGKKKE